MTNDMTNDQNYTQPINLDTNTYNILVRKIDLLSSIIEGQNDIIQNRTTALEETFDSIDKMLEKI